MKYYAGVGQMLDGIAEAVTEYALDHCERCRKSFNDCECDYQDSLEAEALSDSEWAARGIRR